MSDHHSYSCKVDIFGIRRAFIMFVQLVLFTSYSSLIWFCEAHAPLHRIYYGPHRFNPSLTPSFPSSSSPFSSPSIPSSLISSLASSSSPTIDLSLFGNRFIDPQSSSSASSSEPNHDRSENHLYSQFTNSINSIPSCNQLKYLWKEANRLAINLYGPEFVFTHPKLHANPFYLTNLLWRKHHQHTHPFGGGRGEKGNFIESEPTPPRVHPVRPSYEIIETNGKGSNDINSDFDGFDQLQDELGYSMGQPSEGQQVSGEFLDDSLPKKDPEETYGEIIKSPDQLHHLSPTFSSSISSSSSSKSPQSVTSSLQSPSSSSPSTPSPSPSSRKDAKHKPKIGFGDVLPSDPSLDDPSQLSPESSKKVDSFFNDGIWHNTPIDLS